MRIIHQSVSRFLPVPRECSNSVCLQILLCLGPNALHVAQLCGLCGIYRHAPRELLGACQGDIELIGKPGPHAPPLFGLGRGGGAGSVRSQGCTTSSASLSASKNTKRSPPSAVNMDLSASSLAATIFGLPCQLHCSQRHHHFRLQVSPHQVPRRPTEHQRNRTFHRIVPSARGIPDDCP